jgi:hypothetical protein
MFSLFDTVRSMREWSELARAVAWPVVALIAIAFLSIPWVRELLSTIFGRVSRLKGGGFEVELTAERSHEVKADLDTTVRDFRKRVKLEFDRQATVERVSERLETVYKEVIRPALSKPDHGFKATVYVQDVLFKNVLYRLVDYYPRGGGRGSTYSTRYGIIGRAWRLESSYYQTVSSDSSTLIENWGMTLAETVRSGGPTATSFVCVVMRNTEGDRVGLLFVQSEFEKAFSDDIVARLEQSSSVKGLSAAVDKVVRKILEAGQPPIALFDE